MALGLRASWFKPTMEGKERRDGYEKPGHDALLVPMGGGHKQLLEWEPERKSLGETMNKNLLETEITEESNCC